MRLVEINEVKKEKGAERTLTNLARLSLQIIAHPGVSRSGVGSRHLVHFSIVVQSLSLRRTHCIHGNSGPGSRGVNHKGTSNLSKVRTDRISSSTRSTGEGVDVYALLTSTPSLACFHTSTNTTRNKRAAAHLQVFPISYCHALWPKCKATSTFHRQRRLWICIGGSRGSVCFLESLQPSTITFTYAEAVYVPQTNRAPELSLRLYMSFV